MNAIVNKLLLAGDNFMTEMHLKHPGFTYSTCGPFRNMRFKLSLSKRIKQSLFLTLGYGNFKYLNRRRANIAKYPKYDKYQRGLASMFYYFFIKNTSGGAIKKEIMPNEELVEELHNALIRKF